ncbi:hypothetical protein JW823_07305 [bacterium]|nr:hypothetical protein [candidate division CSSED10-310 bacterium]
MAEFALGIFRSGNHWGFAVVQKSYRQTVVKNTYKFTLQSNPDDGMAVMTEMADAIGEILVSEKIRTARISLGLDEPNFLWNCLDMPPVSREDLRQIVRFDLDSHLPVDMDKCLFDVQVQEMVEGLSNRVTLFTAYRSIVEELRALPGCLHLVPDCVTPVDPAIIRYVDNLHPARDEKKLRLILCNTEPGIEIIVSRKGRFIANRTMSSGNPWISDQKPETYSSDDSSDSKESSLLIQTIKLALLISHESSEDIGDIFYTGLIPDDLLDDLRSEFPDVVVKSVSIDGAEQQHYVQTAAISLAYELFEDEEGVNLLPQELRPVRRDTGRMILGAAAGLLVASMVLVGANNYWSTDLHLLKTEAKIASLENKVNLITDVNLRFSATQDARSYFLEKNIEYPSYLDVLLETTRLLPSEDTDTLKKVWLEQFDIENRELTIRGDSDSPEGIITILEESPLFEKVRFDGTVSGTRFTIKANISKLMRNEDDNAEAEFGAMSSDQPTGDAPAGSMKSQSSETSAKSTETPVRPGTQTESENSSIYQGEESEPVERGPAYPRSKPGEPDSETETESTDLESLSPAEQEEMSEEIHREDVEAMKENLFNFIQERKDAGELDKSEESTYQEPEPDEAASNFIEFLKSVADSEKEAE